MRFYVATRFCIQDVFSFPPRRAPQGQRRFLAMNCPIEFILERNARVCFSYAWPFENQAKAIRHTRHFIHICRRPSFLQSQPAVYALASWESFNAACFSQLLEIWSFRSYSQAQKKRIADAVRKL